jgi:hypothetical protein
MLLVDGRETCSSLYRQWAGRSISPRPPEEAGGLPGCAQTVARSGLTSFDLLGIMVQAFAHVSCQPGLALQVRE